MIADLLSIVLMVRAIMMNGLCCTTLTVLTPTHAGLNQLTSMKVAGNKLFLAYD
jgi:hypothetical protein